MRSVRPMVASPDGRCVQWLLRPTVGSSDGRFSLQPSCHLAAVPLSSFSPLSLPPLSLRSLLPRPAAPPPAGPLFSRLLSPFGATPSSSLRILAPQVYRALLAQGRGR